MTRPSPPDRPDQTVAELAKQLAEKDKFFNNVLNLIPDLIFVKDDQHRWVHVNDAFCRALGHSREELIGKTDYDFHPREEADIFWEKDNHVLETETANVNEEVYTDAAGELRTIITKKNLFKDENGNKFIVGICEDITERKRAEQDREKLIEELQEAVAKVRTLSGLLPICASCRKVRDDKGYWRQIESYIRTHTDADFSHGLCPECLDKLYGDQEWYKRRRKKIID